MRFSIWPILQQPAEDLLATCQHAEQDGWDGVWVSDHLMPSREPLETEVLECFTSAASVAAAVPRLRVGTLVVNNAFRHPAVVAKMAATITAFAGERFVLGIGAGWQPNEHHAHGIPLDPPARRLDALDEACSVIRQLRSGERAEHRGASYTLDGAVHRPLPDHLPLLVGVKGDRSLRVAARHADEWNVWGTPARVVERGEVLDGHCRDLGRDPATIARSVQALLVFSDGPGSSDPTRWERAGLPTMTGTSSQLQEIIAAYQSSGIEEVIIPDFNLGGPSQTREALDRFMEEVATPMRT